MSTYNIALVPGDGIGHETLQEGIKVLKAVEQCVSGISFNMEKYNAGAGCYQKTGEVLPSSTFKGCKDADAIFWGSAGIPGVVYPDGTEVGVEAGLRMRFDLDLYANVRPIKLYPNVCSRISGIKECGIDYILVRENTEGLYAGRGGGNVIHGSIATDTMVISRMGTERVSRVAFELSAGRKGAPLDGKRRVTCIDKANILRSWSFFRKVFDDTSVNYPNIEKDYAYADAMACWMILKPEFYDVCVTENMIGDILTDLGAATVGGMGMSPSAELGDNNGLFQGSHGSAPTIAGKNIANPTATIVSGRMMLDWLADRSKNENLRKAAEIIERSVEETFKMQIFTQDLGGKASTSEFGDAVVSNMFSVAKAIL